VVEQGLLDHVDTCAEATQALVRTVDRLDGRIDKLQLVMVRAAFALFSVLAGLLIKLVFFQLG